MSIIERMRKKTLPNPYEIKKEDVGSLLTSRTGDFGEVISADVGKRVYLRNGILQMENTEQMEKRKGKGWRENPDHTGKAPEHRKAALKAEGKGAINEPIRTTQPHRKLTEKGQAPKYTPPYRVDVWEERDRLIITVYDSKDKEVASWVDDEAREMFENGFFESKDVEESVLGYLTYIGTIRR